MDVDLAEHLGDVGGEYISVTPNSKENVRDIRLELCTSVQYVVEREI